MSRVKFSFLLLVLFFIFTQGVWERLLGSGSLLPQFFLELVVAVFIAYQFKIPKGISGKPLLITLIISGIFSGSYNGNSILETFMFLRYFLYGILIYYQLYNYQLGTERWIKLLKFLIFLIILQGIGALYNVLVLGERVEGYVGLMSSLGGTTATTFPLLVSSIILLVYFFTKNASRVLFLISLILLFCVFLVGYSSGKRAVYFFIPLFFIIVFFISLLYLKSKSYFKKKIVGFIGALFLFIPLLLFGIVNSRGLNYGLSGNEKTIQIIENAFNYAEEYESATADGLTIGRSNTTGNIFNKVSEKNDLFFFGSGYNTLKDEGAIFKLGIGYGIVGITRDILSAGVIFALLVALIMIRLITGNKFKISDKFSSALRILLVMIFLFVHFSYSSDFTVHLKLNIVLFILLSLINSPLHREAYAELSKKMGITN